MEANKLQTRGKTQSRSDDTSLRTLESTRRSETEVAKAVHGWRDGPHEDICMHGYSWLVKLILVMHYADPAGGGPPSSRRGGARAEGVGDLEAGVGHPGVVGTGDVLPVDGGGDAVVQPGDVRDVAAADLVAPEARDKNCSLLERVRPLHVLRRRCLLRGRDRWDRVGARRRAQLGETRRGHDRGQEEQR
jgi:hypothetical protein